LQVSKCGDGVVDAENGETCDDGNDDIHDDCLGELSARTCVASLYIVRPCVADVVLY